MRVKEDGTVVDASPLLLGEVDEAFSWNIFGGDHVNPTLNAVAASDDALLVLTEKSLDEGAGGFNQSLTANVFTNLWGTGAPTKTSAILSSAATSRPVVTSDGKDFFASWAEAGAVDSAVVSRISTSAAVTVV